MGVCGKPTPVPRLAGSIPATSTCTRRTECVGRRRRGAIGNGGHLLTTERKVGRTVRVRHGKGTRAARSVSTSRPRRCSLVGSIGGGSSRPAPRRRSSARSPAGGSTPPTSASCFPGSRANTSRSTSSAMRSATPAAPGRSTCPSQATPAQPPAQCEPRLAVIRREGRRGQGQSAPWAPRRATQDRRWEPGIHQRRKAPPKRGSRTGWFTCLL